MNRDPEPTPAAHEADTRAGLVSSSALHRSERDLLSSMEGEGELAGICKQARAFALQPAMVMIAVGENALRTDVDHHEQQRRQNEGDQLLQQHMDGSLSG